MSEAEASWEKLWEYIETQCEPLSLEEEVQLDNEVLALTAEALPEKAGFTYDELAEQVEAVRDAEDTPMPNWVWWAQSFEGKASEAAKQDPRLRERIFKFTEVFAELLIRRFREQGLVYGSLLIAPYVVVRTGGRGRLHRPKPFSDHAGLQAPSMELRPRTPEHIWALSMKPAQTIDRAARGARGWAFPLDEAPTFKDANNKHSVTYFADGLTQEALREGVMQLNPRTADVWRLCTAIILESWDEGEKEPPRVWLDARELCDKMGFKKHHKGGHRPENVAVAARALVDLERFHITIPYGTMEYPEDPRTGKRKTTRVEAQRRDKVLIMTGTEGMKFLFDNEYLPIRWKITAGDWIKAYPREHFARLFRALVELPGTYTPDLWAKALGTELVWQYRQDEGKVQTQRVETMLRQACVLDEARQEKNKKRARDSFEKALDTLQKHGVCVAWEYNGPDIDKVDGALKGWFDLWLQARVIATPPPEMTKALADVAKRKKQHRRRAQKA